MGEKISMKMAKADDNDMEVAFRVVRLLEHPSIAITDEDADDDEYFDEGRTDHLRKFFTALNGEEVAPSLFRVVFGMEMLLDPENGLVDPDAHTIEFHPDIICFRQIFTALGETLGKIDDIAKKMGTTRELWLAVVIAEDAGFVVQERPTKTGQSFLLFDKHNQYIAGCRDPAILYAIVNAVCFGRFAR